MHGRGRLRPHGGRERLAEHRTQALADRLLQPREQTAVAVHRDGDRAVAETFLDRERVRALRDREGGCGVSQLVEHETIERGRGARLAPHAAEVRPAERGSLRSGEREPGRFHRGGRRSARPRSPRVPAASLPFGSPQWSIARILAHSRKSAYVDVREAKIPPQLLRRRAEVGLRE